MKITTTCPLGTTKEVKQDANVTLRPSEGDVITIIHDGEKKLFVAEDGQLKEYVNP